MRARYYDPMTGQFLTREPLVAITRSAYGYVGDNPLNRTDPTGMDWGWNPIDDAAQAWNDTGGKAVTAINNTCYAGPGTSGCTAYADQHPALVPAIAATAAVALALPVLAIAAASAGGAIAGELATTAAVSGAWAAAGQAGVFLAAGGFLASAAAIPIGIAVDMYQGSHGCPGPGSAGNRILGTGLAGSGLGGPSDPMFPEPPSPVTPLPMFPLPPAFP